MAKTGNIDPAFQAAPILKEPTYDPAEFVRRHKLARYQAKKAEQEEIEQRTAKGLEKLMIDVAGWEDQSGAKTILERRDKAMNLFIDLNRKGYNIMNPKTTQDFMARKAIYDYNEETIQLVDIRERNKKAFDLISGFIRQESMKPEEERTLNIDTTTANLYNQLNTKGIRERNFNYNNILDYKPQIGDMYEYSRKNKDRFPVLDTRTEDYVDEETGQTRTRTVSMWTPEKIKEAREVARQLYQEADDKTKRSVELNQERIRKADPESLLASATPEDFFIDSTLPQEAQKFSDKAKGGGVGTPLDIGGVRAVVSPGVHRVNDITIGGKVFNDRYDFTISKPFTVNTFGGEQYATIPYEVIDGKRVTKKTGWEDIEAGGQIKATLLFIDRPNRKVILKSEEASNLPWIENNATFSIPLENLQEAKDFPIKLEGGKMGTIKDILPPSETFGVLKRNINSGVTWK